MVPYTQHYEITSVFLLNELSDTLLFRVVSLTQHYKSLVIFHLVNYWTRYSFVWSRLHKTVKSPVNFVTSQNRMAYILFTGITQDDIDNLPPALTLTFLNIFVKCKSNPPVDWPVEAYRLIMREDLALQAELDAIHRNSTDYMEG